MTNRTTYLFNAIDNSDPADVARFARRVHDAFQDAQTKLAGTTEAFKDLPQLPTYVNVDIVKSLLVDAKRYALLLDAGLCTASFDTLSREEYARNAVKLLKELIDEVLRDARGLAGSGYLNSTDAMTRTNAALTMEVVANLANDLERYAMTYLSFDGNGKIAVDHRIPAAQLWGPANKRG